MCTGPGRSLQHRLPAEWARRRLARGQARLGHPLAQAAVPEEILLEAADLTSQQGAGLIERAEQVLAATSAEAVRESDRSDPSDLSDHRYLLLIARARGAFFSHCGSWPRRCRRKSS